VHPGCFKGRLFGRHPGCFKGRLFGRQLEAVDGMLVRIFSQREIMLFLRDKEMQTMIEEMKAYLRA